jgi:hypothetical protein
MAETGGAVAGAAGYCSIVTVFLWQLAMCQGVLFSRD